GEGERLVEMPFIARPAAAGLEVVDDFYRRGDRPRAAHEAGAIALIDRLLHRRLQIAVAAVRVPRGLPILDRIPRPRRRRRVVAIARVVNEPGGADDVVIARRAVP